MAMSAKLSAGSAFPNLPVATVGGGTGLGTGREGLELLGCAGAGKAKKFAEIVAAMALAGEISMAVAGPSLVGLCFDDSGNAILASTREVYRVQLGVKPFWPFS